MVRSVATGALRRSQRSAAAAAAASASTAASLASTAASPPSTTAATPPPAAAATPPAATTTPLAAAATPSSTKKTPKSSFDNPIFFDSSAAFEDWLAAHHATESQVFVGYYKKASGRCTLTPSDAVDAALCWGWIDGHAKSLGGQDAFVKRFTPRKANSHWSRVNVDKAAVLAAAGRLAAPGRAALARRTPENTARMTFERASGPRPLSADLAARLAADAQAAAFMRAAPAGYRRNVEDWVMAAKRAETRERRLRELVDCSARGVRVKQFAR